MCPCTVPISVVSTLSSLCAGASQYHVSLDHLLKMILLTKTQTFEPSSITSLQIKMFLFLLNNEPFIL